jgi:hypothetical protein
MGNEALCRDICVLMREQEESGIGPAFGGDEPDEGTATLEFPGVAERPWTETRLDETGPGFGSSVRRV